MFYLFAALFATIIEAPHFNDLQSRVNQETLVILDIDDTLLIPKQTLGTDVWFRYELKQNEKRGVDDPLDKTLGLWEAIRHITEVEIVEEGSDLLVEELQNQGISVMGLTTQGLALATRTVKQLQSLHFDLFKTAPVKVDWYGEGALFRKGILFTAGTNKGAALLRFLDQNGLAPTQVVFVNDKWTHLREVEEALEKRGIPFLGLRYSYSDARVDAFQPEIAEKELKYSTFKKILTDWEASCME